jgi:hypothetical protein
MQTRTLRHCLVAALGAAFAFASAAQAEPAEVLHPFSEARDAQPPAPWHFTSLPGKVPTRFEVVQLGGLRVLKVEADQSYGNLVHRTRVLLQGEPTLAWRWRVEQFVQSADLHTQAGDDGAAKLCVFFDYPVDRLTFTERARLKLARAASGEEVPSEVLCYVWDEKEPKGTLLTNAFTNRMRMLVIESGAAAAPGGWVAEHRNLLADYRRAFGQEAGGAMPDVAAVAVSADADNTHGHGLAYFSDLSLRGSLAAQDAAASPPSAPSRSPSAPSPTAATPE